MSKHRITYIGLLLLASLVIRYLLLGMVVSDNFEWVRLTAIAIIMIFGVFFVLKGTASIIEETTEVLSERTKIAGGVLQSIGTAFPDMVLGIVAALMSLKIRGTNINEAVNLAIIAAATTFGSNIYNIGFGAWCVWRQNLANFKNKKIMMFPMLGKLGYVLPINEHQIRPELKELDTSLDILNTLTLLTAIVAICMVFFGKVDKSMITMDGDLYQLIKPVGIFVALISLLVIYHFRKNQRPQSPRSEIVFEEKYFRHKTTITILMALALSGIAILLTAESMVESIRVLSMLTGIPTIITGITAGIIGCLGEMLVIYKFTINPHGRIGDAVVGIAMDNIITTFGASLVAIMGGIFLGGNALIVIFVIILTLNSTLIWQISKLKNVL